MKHQIRSAQIIPPEAKSENSWRVGRVGMLYRDLVSDERFLVSHIRIPDGGEVPDYVHYHKIRFQMIFCLAGWARVVYEDQGEPFVMREGDCVLQPPEIRHRVLESSAGFEVLEIVSPADHETHHDHEMDLPTKIHAPERVFGGQRFVHHVAEIAIWFGAEVDGLEFRDTGISEATGGLASVCVFRAIDKLEVSIKHSGEFLFFFILKGNLQLSGGADEIYHLETGSVFVLPADTEYSIEAEKGLEVLRVSFPADQ